jgi:ubiquinone biosynthesis protein UbiJ
MTPFVRALEDFHAQTAPSDWFEGLAKAYVGDAIAADFYAEVAQQLDSRTRDVVLEVVGETGFGEYAADQLEAAVSSDPRVAGRIALWSRRIVGAALSEAQRVMEERQALSDLFVPDAEGDELADQINNLGAAINRVIEKHSARMRRIQLEA